MTLAGARGEGSGEDPSPPGGSGGTATSLGVAGCVPRCLRPDDSARSASAAAGRE